jgi:membrane protease YdiL (CAAX protease family)
LAAAAGTMSSIVCRLLHLMPSTGEFNKLSPEIAGMALLAVACFEAAGTSFAEECIFRGYMIPALEKRFGTKSAVLLSSALFGLFHLQYAVMTFVVGIILSGAFLRRRSIWAPLVAHIANNTMMTFVGYFLLERAAR